MGILISTAFLFDSINAETKTVFIPISQGSALYTQFHKPAYIENSDQEWYFDASATYRFMQTRNGKTIATKMSFQEVLNTLTIKIKDFKLFKNGGL